MEHRDWGNPGGDHFCCELGCRHIDSAERIACLQGGGWFEPSHTCALHLLAARLSRPLLQMELPLITHSHERQLE